MLSKALKGVLHGWSVRCRSYCSQCWERAIWANDHRWKRQKTGRTDNDNKHFQSNFRSWRQERCDQNFAKHSGRIPSMGERSTWAWIFPESAHFRFGLESNAWLWKEQKIFISNVKFILTYILTEKCHIICIVITDFVLYAIFIDFISENKQRSILFCLYFQKAVGSLKIKIHQRYKIDEFSRKAFLKKIRHFFI